MYHGVLFQLKQNEFVATIPTIGFNVETIEFKNLQFNMWDVGGDPKLRPLWKHYYLSTQVSHVEQPLLYHFHITHERVKDHMVVEI